MTSKDELIADNASFRKQNDNFWKANLKLIRERDAIDAMIARIWDHCQNPGIEHATVGMRVIERIEDEIASARMRDA